MKKTLATIAFGLMASIAHADDHQPYKFLGVDKNNIANDGFPAATFINCENLDRMALSQSFVHVYINEYLVGPNVQKATELIQENISFDEMKKAYDNPTVEMPSYTACNKKPAMS